MISPTYETLAKINESSKQFCDDAMEVSVHGNDYVVTPPTKHMQQLFVMGFEDQNEAKDIVYRSYQFNLETGASVTCVCRSNDGLYASIEIPFISSKVQVERIFRHYFGPNSEASFER